MFYPYPGFLIYLHHRSSYQFEATFFGTWLSIAKVINLSHTICSELGGIHLTARLIQSEGLLLLVLLQTIVILIYQIFMDPRLRIHNLAPLLTSLNVRYITSHSHC